MRTGTRAYLDHNATAPLRDEARSALGAALAGFGNPSSVHEEGRAARRLVEAARAEVAALAGAPTGSVVFTSGGTEANALALSPGLRRGRETGAEWLLVGAGEHPCVLDGHRFAPDRVERIPLDARGLVDLAWLEGRLAVLAGTRVLVSIQLANNETGVVQPVAEAARLVHAHGGLIHTDAVQAAGRIAVSTAELGVDALTLSAHKLGGPAGAGALVLGAGVAVEPMLRGGGQERGQRAGTENVPAIAGFGAAARVALAALAQEENRLSDLRRMAEDAIRVQAPDVYIAGEDAPRLPNTVLFAVPGLKAETALIAFDLAGVALSSGAACSSGTVKRSHVLQAMGVDPVLAEGALRLSLGWTSTAADVTRFAEALAGVLARRTKSARAA